jgi:hypothetical protein
MVPSNPIKTEAVKLKLAQIETRWTVEKLQEFVNADDAVSFPVSFEESQCDARGVRFVYVFAEVDEAKRKTAWGTVFAVLRSTDAVDLVLHVFGNYVSD